MNNDAISKGYISDGLSSIVESGLGRHRDGDLRRELGKELSKDTRESEYLQRGVSENVKESRRLVSNNGRSRSMVMNKEEFRATLKMYSDTTMRKIVDVLNLAKNIKRKKMLFVKICGWIESKASETEILKFLKSLED